MGEINNLSDLFRIFENRTSGRIMYFRGQVRDWPLWPSLSRQGITEQERAKEPECFEKLAEILPSVNDWERATIAQHYGVPTRLIDWSENPLVGLYFALDDKTKIVKGVASLRDGSGLRKLKYPRPFRAWKELQLEIPRTKAQRGSLTSQPDLSKEFDKQNFDLNTQSLKKFIVPKQSKTQLRKQIEILGVTKERLFPDFLDIGNRRRTHLIGACMRIRCELFKTG